MREERMTAGAGSPLPAPPAAEPPRALPGRSGCVPQPSVEEVRPAEGPDRIRAPRVRMLLFAFGGIVSRGPTVISVWAGGS